METDPINHIICSGGMFIARDTKRFLFLLRTQGRTAGMWGFAGGKKEPNDYTPIDTLKREILEEVGDTPPIEKVVPLELFTSNDQRFHYHTYAIIVNNEFIPTLNSEHSGYAWCAYDFWPKPLHQGVKNSLSDRITKAKLELLLELI
jgi:8-oxo-dGTP pyrophosphatase MutT (NUDIX family)